MDRSKRVALITWLSLVATWSATGVASAHFSGSDSVDCTGGCGEIAWEDYSTHDESHGNARQRWEALPGGVDIKPDDWSSRTDLELRDYNDNDGLCGFFDSRVSGADHIKLNDHEWVDYTNRQRYACALHEWGHAHGLDHSYNGQAMDDCPVCDDPESTFTAPQSHDKSDYDQKWG